MFPRRFHGEPYDWCMKTWILAELEIACPAADAAERIYRTFGIDNRGVATYELTVDFKELGLPAIGKLSRTAFVRLGQSRQRPADKAIMISLSWRDLDSDAFPQFHGEIEIVPMATNLIQVAIIGEYKPPFGVIGAVFDAAIGKSIAEATAKELLARFRARLEDAA